MNIIGDVKDKNCIIIDDIVDTAGTIIAAASALKANGAKDVYVACSHPVLSKDAVDRIQDSVMTECVATNSISLPLEKRRQKITQLSIAPILGQGIFNILDGRSISSLFTYRPNK